MRNTVLVILGIMIITLVVLGHRARLSGKNIGRSLSMVEYSLIPAIAGNMIIIASTTRLPAEIGCYIYFIAMDLIMATVVKYTLDYCSIVWDRKLHITIIYSLFSIDIIQILCNPFFRHAFDTEEILVDGTLYYRLVPYWGQAFHRFVIYGFLLGVLVLFIYKIITSPRIYVERYAVILASIIFTAMWETFYIFSRTPIDTSMIGFGIFGMLIYYFSLVYRPLRLLDRMLANIASELPEALYLFDVNSKCIWANEPGLELLGITSSELDDAVSLLHRKFTAVNDDTPEWNLQQVIGEGEDKNYYYLEKHIVGDDNGKTVGAFLTVRDITDSQVELKRQQYNATHDALTGLYNREYLYEAIHDIVTSNRDRRYYVSYLDVSDFKIINDIYGREFGNYVLQSIADWISTDMSDATVFGRLGGDTFGICQPADEFPAERIFAALSDFKVRKDNIEHSILMHLGVYEVNEPDLDVSVMFDRARMALSTIKNQYNTLIAYYDDDMRNNVLWSQKISGELQNALAEKQVRPFLQPLVDSDGKVVGAEALARWVHPEEGMIPPGKFIPVFEQNGMIAELDKYMWKCACEILAEWKHTHPDLFISVNISPRDFYFMDVAQEIKDIVNEYDVDPSRLRVEITETIMMSDVENRINILNDLKSNGFIIEMDDFGSGYSSLNLLKDMPVDVIKIDMMFLNRSKDNMRAKTILHNIITLTDDLGIESLTEGVETDRQYRVLTEMGCKLFQGYYFSKPIPVDEFEEFCVSRTA